MRTITIDAMGDEAPIVSLFRAVLSELGEDVGRPGLLETPGRAAQAWKDWTSGYDTDPLTLLKTFDEEDCKVDEMVVVRNIEFYSHCEHHLAPFFGRAHIGYIPNGRVVGLSKLARVLDAFAKRLQVQERITHQIADCLMVGLEPLGVGVVLEAQHHCMCSRGVNKQHSTTVSSALRGVFREKPEVRAEFMALTRS